MSNTPLLLEPFLFPGQPQLHADYLGEVGFRPAVRRFAYTYNDTPKVILVDEANRFVRDL